MAPPDDPDDVAPWKPPLRLDEVKLAFGHPDRWRPLIGTLTLIWPFLLGVASGLPTHETAPAQGGYFLPLPRLPWFRTFTTWFGLIGVLLLFTWLVMQLYRPRAAQRAQLTVDGDRLLIERRGGTRTIALDDIVHAQLNEPPLGSVQGAPVADDGWFIRLRSGELIALDAGRANDQLRDALLPERRGRAVRAPLGPVVAGGVRAGCVWPAFAIAYLGAVMTTADVVRALRTGTVAMWTVGTLLLWGLAASLIGTLWRRQRVVVGRDGVRIHGPWRMQYIPFEIIQSVTGTSPILLHLDNARRVRLRETEHARGLAKRIRAQMRRWSNERRVGVNPRLDRGDKSVAEWKEALAAGQHDGYRNTSMRLEDLDDLVKDPRAAPEQRVGAALTLASDDAARQRIRIAAEACADPDMEAALEAAAEGEVDERALQRAQHHRAQSS